MLFIDEFHKAELRVRRDSLEIIAPARERSSIAVAALLLRFRRLCGARLNAG
jgi:hypothetical protein